MNAKLVNLVGFQLVWCLSVGGAARGAGWAGPLALVLFAGWTLARSTNAASRRADIELMLACAVLGLAVDSLWLQLGWIVFASPGPWPLLAPAWIVAMWIGFGLTLNHSLSAMQRHPLAALLFGAIGGPFAYWIATDAWAATTIDTPVAYVGLGVAWALLTPALLWLAGRRHSPASARPAAAT